MRDIFCRLDLKDETFGLMKPLKVLRTELLEVVQSTFREQKFGPLSSQTSMMHNSKNGPLLSRHSYPSPIHVDHVDHDSPLFEVFFDYIRVRAHY